MKNLRLKSFALRRFWKDFGGLEAEILDFALGFGRMLKNLRLKSLVLLKFWNHFGELEAEISGLLKF